MCSRRKALPCVALRCPRPLPLPCHVLSSVVSPAVCVRARTDASACLITMPPADQLTMNCAADRKACRIAWGSLHVLLLPSCACSIRVLNLARILPARVSCAFMIARVEQLLSCGAVCALALTFRAHHGRFFPLFDSDSNILLSNILLSVCILARLCASFLLPWLVLDFCAPAVFLCTSWRTALCPLPQQTKRPAPGQEDL